MAIDCLCAGILFADCGCEPIPRLPAAGELITTGCVHLTVGGCAANAGIDLVKLGVLVGVSGCVGRDPFGQFLVEQLSSAGVDIAGVHVLDQSGTAATMIVNVAGEDRRFISTPGASTLFTPDHIPTAWISQCKVLYIGGYLMMPGMETERTTELLRKARAAGAKTVLDVVLIDGKPHWDALDLVLPETDVFLPNDDEAKILTGLDDPLEQAKRFREHGAATVVITRGAEGSVLVGDETRLRAGVYPTLFVGGTGSGDAFDAGFIAGVLGGEDPAGCLRWASAAGASCVRSIGATESVFTHSELETFLQQHVLPIEVL